MSKQNEYKKAQKITAKLAKSKKESAVNTISWITTSASRLASKGSIKLSRSKLTFVSDALSRFLTGSVLGIGSYGIVKACVDAITLRRMAVKVFLSGKINRIPGGPQSVLTELKITRTLKHPNVQHVHNIVRRKDDWFMVMELGKCNVEELIESTKQQRLSNALAHYLFLQLITGLEYIQGAHIVHKDIKPDNLMISYNNILKISDFGVAQKLDIYEQDDTCAEYRGCPVIQPPEIARGDESFSGFKVDIWSCGVTLYKMLTGDWPYEALNEFLLADKIINDTYILPPYILPTSALLLQQLLSYEARDRPSVEKIKQHDWCLHDTEVSDEELELLAIMPDKCPLQSTLKHFMADLVQPSDEEFQTPPSETLIGVYE